MSSKIDLTAVVAAFPPTEARASWRLLVICLTPEATLLERGRRDRAPYTLWHEAALLRTNPGNRIDQSAVVQIVAELKAAYDVAGVGVDPWNAGNLVTELGELGVPVVEVPQTKAQMSAPSKEYEADIPTVVDAGGNPLMEWCMANVVVDRDNR